MRTTIQRFVAIILFILFAGLYSLFSHYFFLQREETSSIILDTMNDDLSELSYILSKTVTSHTNIRSTRAMLDRVVSNNHFIDAIMIVRGDDVLLSNNPQYKTVPPRHEFYISEDESAYNVLKRGIGLEGVVRYYVSDELYLLDLIFIFDQDEIDMRLTQDQTYFMVSFGVIPLLLIAIVAYLFRNYISRPLEKLRQFAYYQSVAPSAFNLKELEAIRSSMLQTFNRLEAEKNELYRMARTDELSGLANRNALNEYLNRLIAESLRNRNEFAIMFLDLDNFKLINDALGHHIGDELLQEIAVAIKEIVRSNDFVSRIGGDEFLIIVNHYSSLQELLHVIDRIQTHLSLPRIIQNHPVNVTSSVGIAFYPKDGSDTVSLMQHADIAMYEAKKKGRSQYHFYTEELNEQVLKAVNIDKAMRAALIDEEFELYYQPKVDLQNGAIVGAEALIRWNSKNDGMIFPDEFIPVAEDNGFIVALGRWIFETACKQQAKWKRKGINIPVSVNLATRQLLEKNFAEVLSNIVKETRADPKKIDLEITEYVLFENTDQNLLTIKSLREKGFSVSLDDFGTGYSSLSYLKQFPIDSLKIDKSFLNDFDKENGAAFIETIINLGKTLDIAVVAEGVETEEQIEYLKSSRCHYYQGYYCSRPVPAGKFENLYHSLNLAVLDTSTKRKSSRKKSSSGSIR
ncbi:MAG: EAL domain-containing protein [Gammaproteobacteria bacterium]|nr:EAL domain-containing protein [Gammaproteobacteria bacterium]MDH5629071.1 EAL domain-containing protein [Gammaproteobacteria bacterium]